MPAGEARDVDPHRHRRGHGQFPGQLRRQRARAGGYAGTLSQSAGQRRRRHRRRHGDQHPAAQSRRSGRCLHRADQRSGADDRRPDQDRAGAGLPDRRHHPRPRRNPERLSHRPRLHRHARQGRDRDRPQGARGDRHLGNPVPGEQGHDDRAHGRTGAREEDRGHRRAARRIRPAGLPRRDRAQARCDARRGAEPALSLHCAADLVRRQHGGARRRPSAGDEPEGHADRLHRLPRGGGVAAHQVPAQQGARPRAHSGGPRHRGRQHRRGDQAHPRLEGRQRGAREVDGAGVAGRHRGRPDRADRRSAPPCFIGRHGEADRRADQGDPRPAPAAPHRARPRRDQGRARQARRRDQRLPRHPAFARAHPVDRQGRAGRR